ncbi:hypothetical protein GGE67_006257 [Rhizobium leucaenae]|nr:hypothetical protein [Rhizobium leucaenae]
MSGETTVTDVARRYDVDRSLVYRWRREFGVAERLEEPRAFVPVKVQQAADAAIAMPGAATVREKFSCRDCEKISQAPAPFHVIPRGWAGPSLLAMILCDKFGQHIPLNRQVERFALAVISPIAIEMVRRIDALFEIERQINGQTADERKATRQQHSKPLISDMDVWMREQRAKLSRDNDLAKAFDYMLNRGASFNRDAVRRSAASGSDRRLTQDAADNRGYHD